MTPGHFRGASLTAGLVLVASAHASAGEWHVSPKRLEGIARDAQLRSISEAAKRAGAGDTVLIHAGVYRESVTVEASGTRARPITFAAAPGERVVVTGADRLRGLRREPGEAVVYSAPWPHRFIGWNEHFTHPGDERHRMIGRAEQVFVRGFQLHQVLERGRMSRGTFWVDLGRKRIHVRGRDDADLTKQLVEASARNVIWRSKGDHVHLRGITFRYAANMAQHGAAQFSGAAGVIEDCVFERTNSSGARFTGPDTVVRRCTFRGNGQLGFGAYRAHNLLMTGCTITENNTKDFARGWEAGADKLVLCRGAVIEKCVVTRNHGNGIWFDIGNVDCVVRNCLIADNDDCGIFYEISYGLHAHDNVIVGNGFADTPGAWGAAAGISLSSSPGCLVERNLIVGNKEGFNFREQRRTTPLIDDKRKRPVWNHDQTVRRNVFAYNRDVQVWGWFDIDDGRHWPAAMQDAKERETGSAAEDIAAKYKAKDLSGMPVGLALEKLKLTFERNLYSSRLWQGLFNWGVTWKRHRRYASLDEVRKELSLGRSSVAGDFVFGDYLTRDFRVPASSPAVTMGCYPKGEVPGVLLGRLPVVR